jgi:predicted kinase
MDDDIVAVRPSSERERAAVDREDSGDAYDRPVGVFEEVRHSTARVAEATEDLPEVTPSVKQSDSVGKAELSKEELQSVLRRALRLETPESEENVTDSTAQLPVNVAESILEVPTPLLGSETPSAADSAAVSRDGSVDVSRARDRAAEAAEKKRVTRDEKRERDAGRSEEDAFVVKSAAAAKDDAFEKRKYEVMIQAKVRLEEDLTSPHITDLPEGTSVTVAEIRGRRARIIRPIHGWLSTHNKMGGRILIPLDHNFNKLGRGVVITDPSTGGQYQGKIIDFDEKKLMHKVRLHSGKEILVDITKAWVQLLQDSYSKAMRSKLSSDAAVFDPKDPTGRGGRLALFHKIFEADYPEYVARARAREVAKRQQQIAESRAAYGGGGVVGPYGGPAVGGPSRGVPGAKMDGPMAGASKGEMHMTEEERMKRWKEYFSRFDKEKYTAHLALYMEDLQSRGIEATPEVKERYRNYYEKKLREKERFVAKQKAVEPTSVSAKAKPKTPRGLIVLRGLPGSGKTSLARKLAARSADAKICTEDKYHWSGGEDGAGEYQFRPELVFLAREWCTKEIRTHIKHGINLVILDNHNARISMYEDHIQYAVKHGYRFRIIEFVGTEEHIDRYRERSYKKFPREVYVKLLKLWEKDPRAELVNPVFPGEAASKAAPRRPGDS